MAAQKEVSAALEQIKRVFEDLAVSRDDKNIYLHRGNLQNISSNRELVQQMENMLKEEQENQRETMQEMSDGFRSWQRTVEKPTQNSAFSRIRMTGRVAYEEKT